MQKLIGLMFVFVLGTGTVLAKDHEMIKDMTIDTNVSANASHSEMEMEHGTSTMPVTVGRDHVIIKDFKNDHGTSVHATTTANARVDLHKVMKAVMLLKHGVPGVVTSVSTNSFAMTVPSGKDHATTTVTVNVSSSTKFSHASSTAALSDITAGTRVEVLGTVSTSSQTIAADRVIIGSKGEGMPQAKKKIFDRIKDFFTGKHASTTDAMIAARGSATAEVGGGFIANLLHSIFGWM